jgi:hypothetical protein
MQILLAGPLPGGHGSVACSGPNRLGHRLFGRSDRHHSDAHDIDDGEVRVTMTLSGADDPD